MKTKRAILVEPGRFEIEELDIAPKPGQVLVKIEVCGLCNWEKNHWKGLLGKCPQSLGHEWAGTVVETGGVVKLKPGDRIMIRDGVVYVNGNALVEPYILEPPYNDYAEITVPEGTFFALGDNRNGSKDSRDTHVGFVPTDNLVGKAMFRVWPLTSLTPIK